MFSLPVQPSEVGPVAKLPEKELTRLPREKRIPEPKAPTKWELFAKQKGIKKKSKERMVYDENQGEFRPRFGYKRANSGIEDIPVVEVKPGQDPYADPWSEELQKKNKRVEKNTKNRLKNEERRNPKKSSSKILEYG